MIDFIIIIIMSVYSTVPNSKFFFKQITDSNSSDHQHNFFNNNFNNGFMINLNQINGNSTMISTSNNHAVANDSSSLNREVIFCFLLFFFSSLLVHSIYIQMNFFSSSLDIGISYCIDTAKYTNTWCNNQYYWTTR